MTDDLEGRSAPDAYGGTDGWVPCTACDGAGGHESLDDSDPKWVECEACEGSEGHSELPRSGPGGPEA